MKKYLKFLIGIYSFFFGGEIYHIKVIFDSHKILRKKNVKENVFLKFGYTMKKVNENLI